MIQAVVDERDRGRVGGLTVERGGADPVLDALGILDGDPIGRRPVAIGDLEARPVAGNPGVDREAVAPEVEPEDRLKPDSEEPRGRPGVPGPASPAGVRRPAVDVGGDDVRLDLVTVDRVGVGRVT